MTDTNSEAIDQVRVRVLPDGRMNRREAATYLGHSEKTLAAWDGAKTGPPSLLVGGLRFYFKDDLDRFIRGEADTGDGETAETESGETAADMAARAGSKPPTPGTSRPAPAKSEAGAWEPPARPEAA